MSHVHRRRTRSHVMTDQCTKHAHVGIVLRNLLAKVGQPRDYRPTSDWKLRIHQTKSARWRAKLQCCPAIQNIHEVHRNRSILIPTILCCLVDSPVSRPHQETPCPWRCMDTAQQQRELSQVRVQGYRPRRHGSPYCQLLGAPQVV